MTPEVMVMSLAGLATKDNCAGDGQQQFIGPMTNDFGLSGISADK
jgi:hypothetical protein